MSLRYLKVRSQKCEARSPNIISYEYFRQSSFNDNVYDLAHRELDEATKDMLCYYTDYSNTTFYFKPDEIEAGLELLNRWYINVELKSIDYTNKQKRANLLKQLQELDTE